MKTVYLLFDSLNRLMLEPYGNRLFETPNFKRLAEKSVTFDRHYVGSMPCIPARRDMQTGRLTFLHRSWGPIEPFDNSFPELLSAAGVYSHLISDHYHYWEDGGATYHTRYDSFEYIRGQESDPWKVMLTAPIERIKEKYHPSRNDLSTSPNPYHHFINREFIQQEADFPSVQCFDSGLDFLGRNKDADNWFLQIETFDPHEPFFAPERFQEKFPTNYDGPILDWPRYDRVSEPPEEIEELRSNYFALLSLCDAQLGRIIDYFDKHNLWADTALVVTTDHGFLLGEHDWWAKNRMPLYEEISHIPLFFYHPGFADQAGTRRESLTQTIDLMPTFCDLYGVDVPIEVEGYSLTDIMQSDLAPRHAVMFGYWGGGINITDGRYTYFCYPKDMTNQELYQYTLMPTHMDQRFSVSELKSASLTGPFDFTKGVPVLRIAHESKTGLNIHDALFPEKAEDTQTVLYDVRSDPAQTEPIHDANVKKRLREELFVLMHHNEAPAEAFERVRQIFQ